MKFDEFTTEQREDMFVNKIDTTLIIDRETLSFETIESDLSTINVEYPFQVPPVEYDRTFYRYLVSSSVYHPGSRSRWLLTLFRTYVEGGRILYRKLNDKEFEVKILFTKNPTN